MAERINLSETLSVLKRYDVPPAFYTVGGLGSGECIGIADEGGKWQTYFSEHGMKTSVRQYASEADACVAFLKDLQSLLAEYGIQRNLSSEFGAPSSEP